MRSHLAAAVLFAFTTFSACQGLVTTAMPDSDHDGISDELESALLVRFEPRLMINNDDCAVRPARFEPGQTQPVVAAVDGTLYGQATPIAGHTDEIELHYYHLWSSDCGEMGHPLDAEHVSALIKHEAKSGWHARYWYAAAHEDTVCDASQITRASTLDAELQGPEVWISRGKHAAFFKPSLCAHGCGGDNCRTSVLLKSAALINLGEPGAPMNGALWVESPAWPLEDKLHQGDFPATRTKRVDQLPITDIAWANPDLRPVQAVILGSNDALGGGATGFRATNTALVIANTHASNALHRASRSTDKALGKAYHSVLRTLQPRSSSSSNAAVRQEP